MGRDGTERATTETAAMKVDRELDHFVGWDLFFAILGMRQASIGKVIGGVDLHFAHRREGWIYHEYLSPHFLKDTGRMETVRLFLYHPEVASLVDLLLQAFFVGEEGYLLLEGV